MLTHSNISPTHFSSHRYQSHTVLITEISAETLCFPLLDHYTASGHILCLARCTDSSFSVILLLFCLNRCIVSQVYILYMIHNFFSYCFAVPSRYTTVYTMGGSMGKFSYIKITIYNYSHFIHILLEFVL